MNENHSRSNKAGEVRRRKSDKVELGIISFGLGLDAAEISPPGRRDEAAALLPQREKHSVAWRKAPFFHQLTPQSKTWSHQQYKGK